MSTITTSTFASSAISLPLSQSLRGILAIIGSFPLLNSSEYTKLPHSDETYCPTLSLREYAYITTSRQSISTIHLAYSLLTYAYDPDSVALHLWQTLQRSSRLRELISSVLEVEIATTNPTESPFQTSFSKPMYASSDYLYPDTASASSPTSRSPRSTRSNSLSASPGYGSYNSGNSTVTTSTPPNAKHASKFTLSPHILLTWKDVTTDLCRHPSFRAAIYNFAKSYLENLILPFMAPEAQPPLSPGQAGRINSMFKSKLLTRDGHKTVVGGVYNFDRPGSPANRSATSEALEEGVLEEDYLVPGHILPFFRDVSYPSSAGTRRDSSGGIGSGFNVGSPLPGISEEYAGGGEGTPSENSKLCFHLKRFVGPEVEDDIDDFFVEGFGVMETVNHPGNGMMMSPDLMAGFRRLRWCLEAVPTRDAGNSGGGGGRDGADDYFGRLGGSWRSYSEGGHGGGAFGGRGRPPGEKGWKFGSWDSTYGSLSSNGSFGGRRKSWSADAECVYSLRILCKGALGGLSRHEDGDIVNFNRNDLAIPGPRGLYCNIHASIAKVLRASGAGGAVEAILRNEQTLREEASTGANWGCLGRDYITRRLSAISDEGEEG